MEGSESRVPNEAHQHPAASQKSPKSAATSSTRSRRREKNPDSWQSKVRESMEPYLPPPVVRGIQWLDPQLRPYIGPEATVTFSTTLVAAWIVLAFIRLVTARILFGSGRAVADEDHHILIPNAKGGGDPIDATVLLVGPVSAGKTRLFYHLCYGKSDMPTVMSMRANVGVATSHSEVGAGRLHRVLYMDWPGYASLDDSALESVLASEPRIILVLDATQPVAMAADILDQLLTRAQYKNANATKYKKRNPMRIYVACHKQDLSKAKNWRRIKIQIRTELERLLQMHATDETSSKDPWWTSGVPLDLDDISFAELYFASTSCQTGTALQSQLQEFCRTGNLPKQDVGP